MNTHQTKGRIYCQAIKINTPSDHSDIVVDPSGFEAAKIEIRHELGNGWEDVHRGDFVLIRDGRPYGVLTEGEFFRHWEPIDDPLADEVASVLVQLDEIAPDDDRVFHKIADWADRLRAALGKAKGE